MVVKNKSKKENKIVTCVLNNFLSVYNVTSHQ